MSFHWSFLSKMWFCLLGLSVFVLGFLFHKYPNHFSDVSPFGFMCFHWHFLSKLWFCLLRLSVFLWVFRDFLFHCWDPPVYEYSNHLFLPLFEIFCFLFSWWWLLQREAVKIPSLNFLKMRKPLSLGCSIWLERGVCVCVSAFIHSSFSLLFLFPPWNFKGKWLSIIILQVVFDCWEDSWKNSRGNWEVLDLKIFIKWMNSLENGDCVFFIRAGKESL